MDAWTIALVAGVVAVASLAFAIAAILAARRALVSATSSALATRSALERAHASAQVAQQESALAVSRLVDVERRLMESDTELRAAIDRAGRLEQRLAETEARLREATEVTPPPIPSGRSAARLDALRATLRAQAAQHDDDEV